MRFLLLLSLAFAQAAGAAADLKDWTLDDKVGQLLLLGYRGQTQVEQYRPGGFVLFSWSMKSVAGTKALTNQLKKSAQAHLKAPLILATDHEGGKVLRLRKGLTPFPDALSVGATGDEKIAQSVGKAMGQELSALGFNTNLAPVLDLGNAKSFLENRVWGERGAAVAKLATAFIQGLQSAGVLAVPKHFPGHGGTAVDSHFELPVVKRSWERYWSEDLAPFRAAVAQGHVHAIMTAHVEVPAVDRGPASLSHKFVEEILRKKMGFGGIVITDDLEMANLSQRLGATTEDLALRALQAGTDMILVVWSKELQSKVFQRIKKAVLMGEVSEGWLDEKVQRILSVKRAFVENVPENPDWQEMIRRPEALRLANLVSRRALRWEAGDLEGVLKSFSQRHGELWQVFAPDSNVERAWRKYRPADRFSTYPRRPDAQRIAAFAGELKAALTSGRPVVVITGPRASSSEAIFSVVRKELSERAATNKAAVQVPILWAHQGSRPVNVRVNADALAFGIVSLNGGTAKSLEALTSFLKEESHRLAGDKAAPVGPSG